MLPTEKEREGKRIRRSQASHREAELFVPADVSKYRDGLGGRCVAPRNATCPGGSRVCWITPSDATAIAPGNRHSCSRRRCLQLLARKGR